MHKFQQSCYCVLNKSYDQVVALCGANMFEVMQDVFVGVLGSGLSGTIVQDCIYKLQNKRHRTIVTCLGSLSVHS